MVGQLVLEVKELLPSEGLSLFHPVALISTCHLTYDFPCPDLQFARVNYKAVCCSILHGQWAGNLVCETIADGRPKPCLPEKHACLVGR